MSEPALAGTTALVTGASRGLGLAIAAELARHGAGLVLVARSRAELDRAVDQVAAAGGVGIPVVADLGQDGEPARVVRRAERDLGPVTVLVNNAAIGASASTATVDAFDDDLWERTMRLNVTVPYLLAKAVIPGMLRARRGRIINIASIHARVPLARGAAYTASKHGLLGLTRVLALELAGTGVTANAICPGPVRTTLSDRRLAQEAARRGVDPRELEREATPLGRRLQTGEVAPLVVFLASSSADAITGQAITIDGGLVLG